MHPIPQIVSLRRRRRASGTIVALTGLTLLGLSAEGGAAPTRSTSIALTGNGTRLVNVNHEADSVTLFGVRARRGSLRKVAEIPVGKEPHCVAVHPEGGNIFVTNGADGTVSVISPASAAGSSRRSRSAPNPGAVRSPRTASGCSSPTIRPARSRSSIPGRAGSCAPSRSAGALRHRVTDDGDNDRQQRTGVRDQFYARLIDDLDVFDEGFDDQQAGYRAVLPSEQPERSPRPRLSPIDSGFTANRARFCNVNRPTAPPANQTFCPNTDLDRSRKPRDHRRTPRRCSRISSFRP